MQKFVFGADIGGTTVKIGLFQTDGELLKKWEIPTRTDNRGSKVLPDIAASVADTMKQHAITANQVLGIGFGVPGPVDDRCNVNRCVNLGWGVFNLKERMNQLLPEIPHVTAGNDANVATLGELWKGGGQGNKSAVMITLGTGVGGGVIVQGKIVAGRNGGAGEIGHMPVEPAEIAPCSCGKCGCLEQYASARGIARMAKQMLAKSNCKSMLDEIPDLNSKHICEAAAAGDPMAQRIMDRFGQYLGRAMSYVSCTVDPDVFIIGGGMSKAGTIVIDAIDKHYRASAFHVSRETPIVLAKLGNDAGIYGCAKMVMDSQNRRHVISHDTF